MNTLRTLPLGFRPTRSSSPSASDSVPTSNAAPSGRSASSHPATSSSTLDPPNSAHPSLAVPSGIMGPPISNFGLDKLTRPQSQPARARSTSRPLVNGLSALALGNAHAPTATTATHANATPSTHHDREKSQPFLHRAVTGLPGLPHRSSSAAPGQKSSTLSSGLGLGSGGAGMERSASGTATPVGLDGRGAPSPMPSPLVASTPTMTTAGSAAHGNITASAATPSAALPGSGTEGGYIDAIGLRLNEVVNKACLGVDFKAKKGFRRGVGWNLGEAVVKELPAPTADTYLLRAVIRTSVRSLTIFNTRLEYFLLPAVTDASFSVPLNLGQLPAATSAAGLLNPAQLFAVGVCHAAWEACEVLEVTLETNTYPRFVAELLRPVMDKLDSLVARVVTPLMANIKKELLAALDANLHISPPLLGGGKSLPPTAAIALLPSASAAAPPSIPSKAVNAIPHSLRAFAAKVDGARKVFELICKDCKDDGESWVTSVVVAVVWKGLCMITVKSLQDSKAHNGRPPSPEAMHKAIASLAKEGSTPSALAHTSASAVSKISSILPSRAVSRPPSPPRKSIDLPGGAIPSAAVAFASFEALIYRLVFGLVHKPTLATSDADATENLAREALAEAEEAILSMKVFVGAIELGPKLMRDVMIAIRDDQEMPTAKEEQISDAVEDAPAALIFSFLAQKANACLGMAVDSELLVRTPAQVWGISEDDFDRQFMSGFGVAEERARRVAFAYKAEIERIAPRLLAKVGPAPELHRAAAGWLRALALALDARTATKCPIEARLSAIHI